MSKLLNNKDFFMCTGGMMPTQMQTIQNVALKKDNETKFLTKLDTSTVSMGDFCCKKLMLLMAIIAVVICALTIATGGMALIAAAAIGGALGAVAGALICGQKVSIARKWIGYKSDFKILGIETLTDSAHMKCMIFGDEIRIAPHIKNWWQALAVGASNFAGEMFKCVMVGAAAAGIAVLATEGVAAFFGNALLNYAATWTSGWGLGLRGLMGVMDGVQQKYVAGQSTEDAINSGFGNALTGMEQGTAHSAYNVATGQGTFEDYTGLLAWGAPVAKGNEEKGPGPETDHMGNNPWEGKPQSGKTGYLESPRMNRSEMSAYKEGMKQKGIDVEIDKKGKLPEQARAGFDPQTGKIYLRKGATQYEAFHEQQHANQWKEMGKEAYLKQSRLQREQHVYDQIMANKEKFSQAELDHAKEYMNDVRRLNGLEPLDAMNEGKDGDLYSDPTSKDGITTDPTVIAARRTMAEEFYKQQNPDWPSYKIDSHLNGIDFRKPVKVVKIPPDGAGAKGNELYQYTKVNAEGEKAGGKYYSDNPNNTPSELGISNKYVVKDANWNPTNEIKTVKHETLIFDESNPQTGLKSTSKQVIDDWSLGSDQPVQTEGGGSQIYIP